MYIDLSSQPLPKIYIRNGKECYLDPIRKKLIRITPEETVRQRVLSYIINELKVPAAMISVEDHLSHYGIKSSLRADILVKSLTKDDELSPYVKYKINDLFENEIALVFATTRTPMSFEYIFKNINVNYPMITMNGAAKYRLDRKRYSDIDHIEPETRIEIDNALKEYNMNAFVYTVNDHVLHAYHDILINDGEKLFYKHRRNQNAYSFVRGTLPNDLYASIYILIDTKEKIENFVTYCNSIKLNDKVTFVSYKYRDIEKTEYYYLRIYDKNVSKLHSVNSIKEQNGLSKLVVCGSGRSDVELLKQADLSMCLDTAPEYVKEVVDYVIHGNAENVLRIFNKIYHSKDPNRVIDSYKNKQINTK